MVCHHCSLERGIRTIEQLGSKGSNKNQTSRKMNEKLLHHVFFWLKNPDSKEDLNALIEGLKTLQQIDLIQDSHIGVPANTEKREVVDHSYAVSWLVFFNDTQDQKEYQDHPIHLKFVKDYKALWQKVKVYDSQNT